MGKGRLPIQIVYKLRRVENRLAEGVTAGFITFSPSFGAEPGLLLSQHVLGSLLPHSNIRLAFGIRHVQVYSFSRLLDKWESSY